MLLILRGPIFSTSLSYPPSMVDVAFSFQDSDIFFLLRPNPWHPFGRLCRKHRYGVMGTRLHRHFSDPYPSLLAHCITVPNPQRLHAAVKAYPHVIFWIALVLVARDIISSIPRHVPYFPKLTIYVLFPHFLALTSEKCDLNSLGAYGLSLSNWMLLSSEFSFVAGKHVRGADHDPECLNEDWNADRV